MPAGGLASPPGYILAHMHDIYMACYHASSRWSLASGSLSWKRLSTPTGKTSAVRYRSSPCTGRPDKYGGVRCNRNVRCAKQASVNAVRHCSNVVHVNENAVLAQPSSTYVVLFSTLTRTVQPHMTGELFQQLVVVLTNFLLWCSNLFKHKK